jgi:nucleoid-associated protein YgaU
LALRKEQTMPPQDPEKPNFSNVVSGSSSTAPSPTQPGAAPGQMRTYEVQPGDNLSKIAKKFYGKSNSWKRIFEANKDIIYNPDLIQPGWTLKIPE